jgi:hypothetical protein
MVVMSLVVVVAAMILLGPMSRVKVMSLGGLVTGCRWCWSNL